MGRVRLPTGGFETLDGSRFKNQRTSSQTAEHGTRSINKRMHEIARAENRLRVIERISKYREDKIRLEFMKLESELKEEEDRQNEMVRREVRQKQYYIKQKERVAEYQKMKAAKRDQELKRQADEQKSAERRRQEKVNLNEELVSILFTHALQKAKIKLYKEYKAKQLQELQVREQVARSQRRTRPDFIHTKEVRKVMGTPRAIKSKRISTVRIRDKTVGRGVNKKQELEQLRARVNHYQLQRLQYLMA